MSCAGYQSVYYESDEDRKKADSYRDYAYKKFGFKSVAVPLDYHIVFYDKKNYGYDEAKSSNV